MSFIKQLIVACLRCGNTVYEGDDSDLHFELWVDAEEEDTDCPYCKDNKEEILIEIGKEESKEDS